MTNGKVLFPGNILINKTRPKILGVTTLPPLRKISSSRFVKSCNDDARIKGLCRENAYIRSNNSGKRNILEKYVAREKAIKTELTAVTLLTKQELKKVGSVA